ncbi:MAG: WXG100 family type VII secretion target [Bacilli bacterium]|nr:WXG100 family type VII secretion target [Bacilli bacterium]
MNNGLHAAASGIMEASTTIISRVADYASDRAQLASAVTELTAIWRGEASEAFKNSFDAVNKTLDDFGNLLGDLGGAVAKVSSTFEEAELENKNSADRLSA